MLIYSMSVSVDGFIVDARARSGGRPFAGDDLAAAHPPEHLVEPVLDRPQRAVDRRRALIVRN
jgi:hypothetical protein